MSTINTILDGDSGSSSLGDINTNFSNLNTDKIEADDTKTLTNKSIDAANNSITNLDTDDFASSAKTGSDAKLVTGTAGDADEIAKFNADGDLVSTDIKTTATAPSSSSDDTTIPTSEAVHEAMNNTVAGANEMFIYPTANSASSSSNPFNQSIDDFYLAQITSSQSVFFTFRVPSNFASLTEIHVVMIPDVSETINYDLISHYAAENEDHDTHNESDSSLSKVVEVKTIEQADVSTVFTAMAGGDYCALQFASNTSNLRVIGLYFKYAV